MPRTQLCAEKPLHVMVHVHADWNWKDGKHIYESEFSDETSVGHVHTYTVGVFLGSPSSVLFPFGIYMYCIGMYNISGTLYM